MPTEHKSLPNIDGTPNWYYPSYENVNIKLPNNKLAVRQVATRTEASHVALHNWYVIKKELEDAIAISDATIFGDIDVYAEKLTEFARLTHEADHGSYQERYQRQLVFEEIQEQMADELAAAQPTLVVTITDVNVTELDETIKNKIKDGEYLDITFSTTGTISGTSDPLPNYFVCYSSNKSTISTVTNIDLDNSLPARRVGEVTLTFFNILDPSIRKKYKVVVDNKIKITQVK